MQHHAFSDGAIVHEAWRTVKANLGFFIGGILLTFVLLGVLIGLAGAFADNGALYGLFMVLYYVAALLVGAGWIKVYLAFADGNKPKMSELFTQWNVLLKFFAVNLLYGIIVYVGFFLLVFPSVIWGLKYSFAPTLVVDKDMGPIEALKKSGEMTMGSKWDLLGFYAVIYAIMAIGALALFVGLFVAVPVGGLGMAMVYRKMMKATAGGGSKPAAAKA